MDKTRTSCGIDFCSVPHVKHCLHLATSSKYDFVFFPVVHPRYKRECLIESKAHQQEPFTRSDMILCNTDWSTFVVAKLSPHIDVDRGSREVIRNNEEMLKQELNLVAHLGVSAVSFKLTGSIKYNTNFARIISHRLAIPCNHSFWVQVPMENPRKQASFYREDLHDVEYESPWEWWNSFRVICDFDRRLGVALIVSQDIPDQDEVNRWLGEPVKCLIIPTEIFISNKKNYPVLSRAHQLLVKKFCVLEIQLALSGANHSEDICHYQAYLNYLHTNWKKNGPIERYAFGYEDYLQCPLQPLMDNLESGTYEVFEKDPVKYTQYQVAIHQAILSKAEERDDEENPIVIMVVGAGRGPLVLASLNAAENAKKEVRIYAVEKNPNAIITLQALKREVWGEQVTVVSSDMRTWEAPEKADILVSELLGSFGDNELSPECLDGAQKFLKDDGISIPSSYTSYIAPVQSSKLYTEVRSCKEANKYPLAHFETSYVVHLQNKFDIDEPQPLFTFHHPNREVHENTRYEERTFRAVQNGILHGLSGYFDTVLFEDVTLSILPKTHSPGMISWFPIFFPIKEPVHVKEGDEIVVHFWRCCSAKDVWYEWSITKPVPISIHNPNGRGQKIGL